MTQTTTAEITGDTDTTVVPAPGVGQRQRIHQIAVGCNLVGTNAAIEFENGVGGAIVFSQLAAAGGRVERFDPPLILAEDTLLNVATKGSGVWNITVWHEG